MFDSTTTEVARATLFPSSPRFQLSTLNFQALSLQHSNPQTFQPSNVFRPIPFLFTLLRTLLQAPKTQLLCFQAIPHSFPKTPGGGGTPAAILSYISSLLLCTLPQIQSDKAAGIIDPTKFINAFVSDEDADTDTNTNTNTNTNTGEDTDLDSDEDSDVDSDSETPTENEMETRLHSINTWDPSIPEPDPKKKPS